MLPSISLMDLSAGGLNHNHLSEQAVYQDHFFAYQYLLLHSYIFFVKLATMTRQKKVQQMSDILTEQIIHHLKELPIVKKKAILELIKEDASAMPKFDKVKHEQWRNELVTTSVWSDAEIEEIYKAREYINKWKSV